MNPWQFILKKVSKTRGTRYRVWLLTLPLEPLPTGKAVEFRWHLKQWDATAKEPLSWCIQETKYAAKESGAMDPYKPFQITQYSQRDWPAWLATKAPEIREVLEEALPRLMAAAPPVQQELPEAKEAA